MRTSGCRLLLALVLLMLTLVCNGCWNHRELDTMAIVAGAGIDFDDVSGKYVVTVQVVMPSANKESAGNGGGQAKGVAVVTGTGSSVFEAIRSMTTELSRKPYWPHNQILVVGDSLARKGLRPVLDFFLRDAEPRLTTWLLVAPGKAHEIIAAPIAVEKIPAFGIAALMSNGARASSLAATATLHDFVGKLVSGTTAPIAARISLVGDKGDRVQTLGTAVFMDDRLVGELDSKETRGLLWVSGKMGSGIITVSLPGEEGTVAVEIIRSNAQITSEKRNGHIAVRANVFMEGNVGTDAALIDATTPRQLDLLDTRTSSVIRDDITAAISKAQTLHTDVLGFGSAIERKFPREWQQMKKEWDQQFERTEVALSVQVNIHRVGLLNRPLRTPE